MQPIFYTLLRWPAGNPFSRRTAVKNAEILIKQRDAIVAVFNEFLEAEIGLNNWFQGELNYVKYRL